MGTYVQFRGWLRVDLNDPAGAAQRFGDGDLDRAVDRAVAELTGVWPKETDTEHTCGAASRILDLSGAPYAGALLDVSEVEMPYGAAGGEARFPPELVAFQLDAGRTKLRLLSREVPAAGQVVRVRWSSAQAVTASSTTVPVELDALVALGAAGFACLAYSTPAGDNFKYEDGETVGQVDDSMIGPEWRRRGREHLATFRAELGKLGQRRARTGRPWVSWGRVMK